MTAQEELNDKKIIKLQADMNALLRNALADILTEAKDYNRWIDEQGWKPNQTMTKIENRAEMSLSKLDVAGARLDHIKRGILPREQKRLLP